MARQHGVNPDVYDQCWPKAMAGYTPTDDSEDSEEYLEMYEDDPRISSGKFIVFGDAPNIPSQTPIKGLTPPNREP